MELTITAKADKGRIIYDDPVKLSKILTVFNGKDLVVTFKDNKNRRSISQNKYYWKCIIDPLAEHTGYSRDEMHEILRAKFLPEEKTIGGETIHFSRSTTTLNTAEMENYLSEIREWASVYLQVFLALPNEF